MKTSLNWLTDYLILDLPAIEIANKLTGLGLEMGGKDPAYICDDADMQFTIPKVMDGVFYNAGQSCCGVERIYVHESVYEQFLEGSFQEMENLVIGNPFEKSTTMGPLVSAKSIQFLENQKENAIINGAKLLLSGVG